MVWTTSLVDPRIAGYSSVVEDFVSQVAVMKIFDSRTSASLHLPPQLTTNSLIAIMATLNRAFLTAPVASGIMQDMWLYLATRGSRSASQGYFGDLEPWSNAAS